MEQNNVLSLKKLGAIVTGQEEVQGETISDVLNFMAENYQATGGGADEALAELEYKLSNGYTDYSQYFMYKEFLTEIPFEIFKHYENCQNFIDTFYQCKSLTELPSFNLVNATTCYGFADGCTKLKKVGVFNVPNVTDLQNAFYGCIELETVEGIDMSSCTYAPGIFGDCWSLKEITFHGVVKCDMDFVVTNSNGNITHDTLMSLINALYDWASEGSTEIHTLTFGSVYIEKLSEDEKYIVQTKGWYLQ